MIAGVVLKIVWSARGFKDARGGYPDRKRQIRSPFNPNDLIPILIQYRCISRPLIFPYSFVQSDQQEVAEHGS